jgi:hypothetical protein
LRGTHPVSKTTAMYIKKVKLQVNKPNEDGIVTTRIKLIFQESPVNKKTAGMSLKSKDDERFTIVTLDEGAKHPEDHVDVELAGQYIVPLSEQLMRAQLKHPVGADFTDVFTFGEQVATKDGELIPRLYDYNVI